MGGSSWCGCVELAVFPDMVFVIWQGRAIHEEGRNSGRIRGLNCRTHPPSPKTSTLPSPASMIWNTTTEMASILFKHRNNSSETIQVASPLHWKERKVSEVNPTWTCMRSRALLWSEHYSICFVFCFPRNRVPGIEPHRECSSDVLRRIRKTILHCFTLTHSLSANSIYYTVNKFVWSKT